MLSIFDQSRRDENDNRLLKIDEAVFADDSEMEHIIHRLTMAAADADMRHKMNVEDEYYSAIEKRDTVILMKDRKIAEQQATLKEQESMLRSTIKLLLDAGMSPLQIASSLGVPIETVSRLI